MVDTEKCENVTPLPVMVIEKGDPFFRHAPCALVMKCGTVKLYVRNSNKIDDLSAIMKYSPFPAPPDGVDCVFWQCYRPEEQAEIDKIRVDHPDSEENH
jgi:hypothetical protein